jgi:superoxide dismutase
MSPNPTKEARTPEGKLLEDITEAFGTYTSFKEGFTGEALALFGSGQRLSCSVFLFLFRPV